MFFHHGIFLCFWVKIFINRKLLKDVETSNCHSALSTTLFFLSFSVWLDQSSYGRNILYGAKGAWKLDRGITIMYQGLACQCDSGFEESSSEKTVIF